MTIKPLLLLATLTVGLLSATAATPSAAATQQPRSCCKTQCTDLSQLPRTIFSGEQDAFHVQGIAVDLDEGCIYYSFTTSLLKTDLQGRLLGSVTGMTGHLGCLTYDKNTKRIYGSLEYKNDEIGKGIRHTLDGKTPQQELPSGFYIAIFDGGKITRANMNAETDDVMKTVYLKEVVDDYYGQTINGGRTVEHRFGCSGIDGVSLGPAFGAVCNPAARNSKSNYDNRAACTVPASCENAASCGAKQYLHVAYGVYGDTTRTDNDYQVILAYDIADWAQYERTLSQGALHKSGPERPQHKYFVRTGNTSYGIQNLAYDPASGNYLAAVYRGRKPQYPNYSIFAIDATQAPRTEPLRGFDTPTEGEVLSLAPEGLSDPASGLRGWQFRWGTTGLCPLGEGYFYISEEAVTPDTKRQSSTLRLYRWTGRGEAPFEPVE